MQRTAAEPNVPSFQMSQLMKFLKSKTLFPAQQRKSIHSVGLIAQILSNTWSLKCKKHIKNHTSLEYLLCSHNPFTS